jgi:hypothetical protein
VNLPRLGAKCGDADERRSRSNREGNVILQSLLVAVLWLADAPAPAPATATAPQVCRAAVLAVSRIEPVVSVGAGRQQGVAIGDAAAIVDGATVLATGRVIVLDDTRAALQLEEETAGRASLTGKRAVMVSASWLAAVRGQMPPGTTVRAQVSGVGPASRQFWIDAGSASGFAAEDTVWVLRDDFPVARGRVASVLGHAALVQSLPLVANALPDEGDAVELWPSPAMRRGSRPESVVMAVTPNADGAELTLAGSTREGFVAERQAELYDGGEYVGLAGITTASDRLCLAQSLRAFCTKLPVRGLRAVVRPAGDHRRRLDARIFDVRPGYALVSAGDRDGVRIDDVFAVLRNGQIVGRLAVKAVKDDFAGTEPIPGADGTMPELQKWDRVVREPLPPEPVQRVGAVESVARSSRWLAASLVPDVGRVDVGEVVRIAADPPAAAIVTAVADSAALLYVPSGWGPASLTSGQAIERVTE